MANAARAKRKAPPFTFFDGERSVYRPQFTKRDGGRSHPLLRRTDGELVRDECDVRPAMIKYLRGLVDADEIDAHCGAALFYLGDDIGEEPSAKVIPLLRGETDDVFPEIPSHLYSEIVSWRRIIHSARAEDGRDLLRRAALNLHRVLLIVETEAPTIYPIAGQVTMDALQEFANFHLIDPDDAQLIFAEAKKASADASIATAAAMPDGGLIISKASDVIPERIEWVWPGRVARGKHTAIAGDPGAGKSQLMISIVAAVTTGADFPCGEGQAPIGNVVILAAEDGIADTIVPRLKAAGADLDRVSIITAVRTANGNGTRTFNLQADLDELSKEIAALGNVVLVCIDPVSSYVGKVDSHKNAELRGVLEPLGRMAEETRVAVLSITHFSKGGAGASTNSLYRFIGSIAFVAAPRAAFVVMLDPDDKERRLFLHSKNNLAKPAQGLAFRLAQCLVVRAATSSLRTLFGMNGLYR